MTILMTSIITGMIIAIVTLIYLTFNNKENNISKGIIGIILSIFPFPLLFIGSAIGFIICPVPAIIFGRIAKKEKDKNGKIAIALGILSLIFALGIFAHFL